MKGGWFFLARRFSLLVANNLKGWKELLQLPKNAPPRGDSAIIPSRVRATNLVVLLASLDPVAVFRRQIDLKINMGCHVNMLHASQSLLSTP